jgi:hypothetical protein
LRANHSTSGTTEPDSEDGAPDSAVERSLSGEEKHDANHEQLDPH